MSDTPNQNPTAYTDSFEEHLQLPPGLRQEQDKAFIAREHAFQGKKLFPYSEGIRLLLTSLSVGSISNDHWLLILMFLLMDLQEEFDKAKARAAADKRQISEDEATDLAVAELLERIGDNPRLYQAQIVRRAKPLKKKGVEEATRKALEIYQEANLTEVTSSDNDAEGAPPK